MSSPNAKKAKIEYFPDVGKIEYKGDAADNDESHKDGLYYRHYCPSEIIMGKPMKEWLKFSVCFWHTMKGTGADPFGSGTHMSNRSWEATHPSDDPIALAKRRVDVFFEILTKLQVEYYCFHDYDVAPEGATIAESQRNLDIMVAYLLEKQNATGIKLLWMTQNLFSDPVYMNGGMTSPQVDIYARACAQTKHALGCNHKLGGLSHVFWGGREGYQSLLNTNLKKECDHMASFYKMVVSYMSKNNYQMQLLLEPKPKEPMKHQYDYDAQTTLHFLSAYGLQDHFMLNIEPNHTTLAGHAPEHDVAVACAYNKLGSIDSNTGDTLLGWDTDQFPMNLEQSTSVMTYVVKYGGLPPYGGLNFDAKVRRESTDPNDLIIAHVGAMDCYALGLRKAVEIVEAGDLQAMLDARYLTWSTTDIGRQIENGNATLEECSEYVMSLEENEDNIMKPDSGKQELYEIVRNRHLYG